MRLRFKYQKFQEDAVRAVCDVFKGQPKKTSYYIMDKGEEQKEQLEIDADEMGIKNYPVISDLSEDIVLENLQRVQKENQLKQSEKLEGKYNLTIEMETGVGKTYTYIKTIYELNINYGWTKFIVVVPSIAIREGVFASLKTTQEHFMQEYKKKIRFFIYNSSRLNEIESFASDGGINLMIINSQAFNSINATKEAIEKYEKEMGEYKRNERAQAPKEITEEKRKIYMKLDSFRSRRPIDVIAKTNPIMIIDEPQSVEGKNTKEALGIFEPLITLRYSATPKEKYNLIYRLDAIEAYNRRLVKKIAVKGITISGGSGTNGYIYIQGINLHKNKNPTVTIEFDFKGANGIKRVIRNLEQKDNLYAKSGELDEYKNNYIISSIDSRDNSVSFLNGIRLYVGSVIGEVNEDQIRRLQIRETIRTHLEMEEKLYSKGIKVLSLFFIDEVAKYKKYDESGCEIDGIYASIFEEEYNNTIASQSEDNNKEYFRYLKNISAKETHAGYFSIDKNKRIINSKEDKKEGGSTDKDAYDLIMRNKERLLNLDEPVRFIFSHSALKEGWDNPNVFQICALKKSNVGDRKRQEIGRGLRLCVNQKGERIDGGEVHDINVLTVIANESYEEFTKNLQTEIASVFPERLIKVDAKLFEGKVLDSGSEKERIIDCKTAKQIENLLLQNNYIDEDGKLTEQYDKDKKLDLITMPEGIEENKNEIINILNTIDKSSIKVENAFEGKYTLKLNEDKLNKKEFKELWTKINSKSSYHIAFNSEELIEKSIMSIDKNLSVTRFFMIVEHGIMNKIDSKKSLEEANAFEIKQNKREALASSFCNVKYDLVGKVVENTGLTRKSIGTILKRINGEKFNQFKLNPEDFITKISNLINEQKAMVIIKNIKYYKTGKTYELNILTEPNLKTITDKNAVSSDKNLYNFLIYDSKVEMDFGRQLDLSDEIEVYMKLPKSFYIDTPIGKYNPDWAISFKENSVEHIYFVAETKGSTQNSDLRQVEQDKIKCAKLHFDAISSGDVKYAVVNDFDSLLKKAELKL